MKQSRLDPFGASRGGGHTRSIALAVALAFSGFLAACGGDGDTGQREGESDPIVIGMPIALSGGLNFYDEPWRQGVEAGVEEMNNKGGALGRRFKIILADTKSDLANTTNVAKEVLADGADFLFPTVDYDFGSPAARAGFEEGKLAITQTGDPRWSLKGLGPLAFNIYQATPGEAAAMVEFARSEQRWGSPYVLIDQGLNYSKSLGAEFQKSWKKSAGPESIAGVDTFNNDDKSIATQITRLKAASPQPDFIVLASFIPGGASALRQIRAAGVDLPVLTGVTFDGTSWMKTVPKEDNFYGLTLGALNGDPDPSRQRLLDEYREKHGQDVSLPSEYLNGYAAVQALKLAIERAESIDSEKVKTELERFKDEPLVVGPTTWTADCHLPIGRPFRVVSPTVKTAEYVATVEAKPVDDEWC